VFDAFRFAWFAVRTFAGFVLLVLALYATLWAFVKIDSMATRNVDHDAALQLVKSYNAQTSGQNRKPQAVPPTGVHTPNSGLRTRMTGPKTASNCR
jgi:hypothetical protein